jgi:hypothetical protein
MKLFFTAHDVPDWQDKDNPFLDLSMFLQAGHTVAGVMDADVIINLNNHSINGTNVVMLSWEPAFHAHVRVCYTDNHLYHSVFRLGPCDATKGSFPITQDPLVYPYHPNTGGPDLRREDTTLRDRRVFFAGMARYTDIDDVCGREGLYATRTALVNDLKNYGVDMFVEGKGFGNDSRKDGNITNWDIIKRELCQKVRADFHLCAENCRLENYVSEKIHHGFQSDLVVLYLGNPDIHKWVPSEAFINLNEYYDPKHRRVNAVAVADLLKTMTQREYDDIIHAAREWRRTANLQERFLKQTRRLTQAIVDRLEQVQ